jgi:hypothetical protein
MFDIAIVAAVILLFFGAGSRPDEVNLKPEGKQEQSRRRLLACELSSYALCSC